MDVVALMVLGTLALTGLVGADQALLGFSNPAVVTVWAMFILSDGLTRTGIADIIGRQVLKLAGKSEARIIAVIMLTSGFLSAFMNNIGVAALMLPVVIDIAHKTGNAPSRLLMPLAYGSLLGGLTTLIGTPPNLLVSESLASMGLRPFSLFDFAPVGIGVMLVGTAFVAFGSRFILPENKIKTKSGDSGIKPWERYNLTERTMLLQIPQNSILDDKTLGELRFGSAIELSVLALIRDKDLIPSPGAREVVHAGDRLLVQGRIERFLEMRGWRELFTHSQDADLSLLFSEEVGMFEVGFKETAPALGKTMLDVDFRKHYGLDVIAVLREPRPRRTEFAGLICRPDDRILVQGRKEHLAALKTSEDFTDIREVSPEDLVERYQLQTRIFSVKIPADSPVAGKTLKESRLGEAFAFNVLGVVHHDRVHLMVGPDDRVEPGDTLIIQGKREYQKILHALNEMTVVQDENLNLLELNSRTATTVEAVLSPRSTIAGKTPRALNFHNRYGLQLLGLIRGGQVYRSNLRNMAFQFGDAFLLFGKRKKIQKLRRDPDFVVLTQGAAVPIKREKAPLAGLIMAAVLVPVLFGWIPIAISAICGATLMVLTGCLNMQQAYRAIEWRAIFLIAGMLPLGAAMQDTGAAALMADGVMSLLGGYGPWIVILGLYIATSLATTIIPTAALVVMMAPIMIKACTDLGVSPHAGMMAVAMAASASFTSPISHPANILVMGPGGYRFVDYLKLGVPLAILVMIVVFLTIPIFWPLYP